MGLDFPNFKNEYDINLIQRYEQFKNNVDEEQEKLLNLGERVNYLRRKKVVFCSENRNKEVAFTGISEWINEKILFIRKNELENKLESIDYLDQRINYLKTQIINEKIEIDGYSSTQKYDYWVKYDDSSLKGYDKEKANIYQSRELAIQEDKKDREIESEKLIQWISLKINSIELLISYQENLTIGEEKNNIENLGAFESHVSFKQRESFLILLNGFNAYDLSNKKTLSAIASIVYDSGLIINCATFEKCKGLFEKFYNKKTGTYKQSNLRRKVNELKSKYSFLDAIPIKSPL